MRVLHTSDWHLGVSADTAPRHEEHQLFLEWLLGQLTEERVDVLVISGDVFHYTQPSAAAQAQFFEFLARSSAIPGLDVVVVAGNHDSPSRLDAPQALLKNLNVHVVGNLPENLEECLIHVERGKESLVVAAIPYISESKLGIVTTDKDAAQIRDEYNQRFREIYMSCADSARERWPDARMIATGHLTCVGDKPSEEGDYQTPLHQAMMISGLSADIFGQAWEYVALGHIHRCHAPAPHVWYSGTPVPTAITEAFSPRYVMLWENGTVERVEVPRWRDLWVIEGTAEELRDVVENLVWECELPPYLYMELDGEGVGPDFFQRILSVEFPDATPRIASFRRKVLEVQVEEEEAFDPRGLDSYTPEEVFVMNWKAQYQEPPGPLELAAFRELLSEIQTDGAAD